MVKYLDIIVEKITALVGKTDQMEFTPSGLKVDGEFTRPEDIYGNAITLPGTLPDQDVDDGVTIKAKDTNVADVDVNGFALASGESIPLSIDNLSKVLVTGNAGDIVYYLGS